MLVATIWLLAIIVLAAGAFALWTEHTLGIALQRQRDAQAEVDSRSTLETLLYFAATRPTNAGGISVPESGATARTTGEDIVWDMGGNSSGWLPAGNEVRLDGRPYKGLGDVRFSLQDEAGLLAINRARDWQLQGLLQTLGIPEEQHPPLIDRLRDYVDEDDLRRLHGAEEDDYRHAGLPPPANRRLLAAAEVTRVLGWHDRPEFEGVSWADLISVSPVVTLNINAATPELLRTIPGMNDAAVQRVLEYRRDQVYLRASQAFARAGIVDVVGDSGYITFPSEYWRITLWERGARRGWRYHIQLTPLASNAKPWAIHQVYPVSVPEQSDDEPQSVESPLFTAPLSADE